MLINIKYLKLNGLGHRGKKIEDPKNIKQDFIEFKTHKYNEITKTIQRNSFTIMRVFTRNE